MASGFFRRLFGVKGRRSELGVRPGSNVPIPTHVDDLSRPERIGVRGAGESPPNLAGQIGRRSFLRRSLRAAASSTAIALLGGIAVDVKREGLIARQGSLLAQRGVKFGPEWASLRITFSGAGKSFYKKEGKFSVSDEEVNGMNVIGNVANAAYHESPQSSRPNADQIKNTVVALKKHWAKAANNPEGVGAYVKRLETGLDYKKRFSGRVLDLLLVNPSYDKRVFSSKAAELQAIWDFLWKDSSENTRPPRPFVRK